MQKQAEIKERYENGETKRKISREMGLSQQTVRKYAERSDWREEEKATVEYNSPTLAPYTVRINEWLEKDKREPRKQRHTIMRIYDRLCEEHGYTGSYCTVKRYVNRYKWQESQSGILPLQHPPGHAQLDFGEFKYYDSSGAGQKGYELVISFVYSNKGYHQVFRSNNQECLLEGMKKIFYHIGGVPPLIKTDNMTPAVAQILEGAERVLTDGFTRFKLHHQFKAEFCNPSAGNEKGNVENKVGYLRRNLLVPVPTIVDFDEYNQELLQRCEKLGDGLHYRHNTKINELFERDKAELLSLPEHEYDVFRYDVCRVDKYGFVTVDTNRYGISPDYAGDKANVKVYADKIEIFAHGKKAAEYNRSYESNQEISEFQHYLNTLSKKPGGIGNIRFWSSFPPMWKRYLEGLQTSHEKKSAVTILKDIVCNGHKEICDDILSLALERGRSDPEHIRQCYITMSKPEMKPEPMRNEFDTPFFEYAPDLSGYDRLAGGIGV